MNLPVHITEISVNDDRTFLEHFIARRVQIDAQIKQLEEEKKDVNETMAPIIATYGKSVMDEQNVKATVVNGSNVSYDTSKVKAFLLENGVPADVVAGAWEQAKTVKQYTTVSITLPKEEKDK